MDNVKILAIDTSTSVASIALSINNKIKTESVIDLNISHSESLMPEVERVLEKSNTDIRDIDIFAVSKGPGSFTGIRIGVMAVKTFAYANNKKIADVCTLDAIVRNAEVDDGVICPLIDARNTHVFTAVYDSQYNKLTEYIGVPVAELSEIINKTGKKVTFVGELSDGNREILQSNLKVNMNVIEKEKCRASFVADIAYKMYKDDELKSAEEVNPYYLRKSQAERMKK